MVDFNWVQNKDNEEYFGISETELEVSLQRFVALLPLFTLPIHPTSQE